jgi:hypothetical protein
MKKSNYKNNNKNKYKKKKTFVSARENVSSAVPIGAAIRSRDEFFHGGVLHEKHENDKEVFYRKAYVLDSNNLDELAVVKSSHKGHSLKSDPNKKFTPNVYIMDDKGNPIKIGKKFVRRSSEDIKSIDVDYMFERCRKYPDTLQKIAKLKSRRKNKKSDG